MLALPPLSCPVPSRPHLGNGVTLTAESHCESLLRLGGAGGVGMARSALWVGSVVRGTFARWRGRGRCRPPCDSAAVSRGADPLFSGPRLPWAPGPGASDPTHAIGCPGLLWGGDTPRRGPCPRPEPDPTPLSPLLPWALTFGLGCVPLCTVQVYQEYCQVCSAGTPYRVYLMGSSPLATPPSARLWGGWFGQNPTRWCFLLVIATHCPHLFLACKFPSPGCAECPISSPIARPPDVGASG